MTLLSILTISRNLNNLEKLLEAIPAAIPHSAYEVLCSWNGDTSMLRMLKYPQTLNLEIIEAPYNFSKNNNQLAKMAKGKYLLFINDDIIPDIDSIERGLKLIQEEYIGMVGANLRYPNGLIQHAGVFFNEDGSHYHRFKGQILWDDPTIRNDAFVPAITGACIFIRRDEFLQLGFDERFIVAGEDIVLSLHYRQKFPREILYLASATMIHEENTTRRQNQERLTPAHDLEIIREWANKEYIGQKLTSVRAPKIRIVSEEAGWILHRMALELQNHLPHVHINEESTDADIHYYINYGRYKKRPQKGLVLANFTHYDPHKHGEKFIQVAKEVDHCISISEQTSQILEDFGIPPQKITTIIIGADHQFTAKLTLGVVGRSYGDGRKGEDILQELSQDAELMQMLQIVAYDDTLGLPRWQLPSQVDFYRAIDYLLITSRIEGGPVPFMEALACGTLAIAPPIGVIPQFPHISYPVGDIQALKQVLKRLALEHQDHRSALSKHLYAKDWYGWAAQHDKVFRKLLWQSRKPF